MSAREDIKRRRRRRERQERWERDPRRPVSLRTLRRLKAMCRKLGPIPGDRIDLWGEPYKPGAFLADSLRDTFAALFPYQAAFAQWRPVVLCGEVTA